MRNGYLRGSLTRPATKRQMDVLVAFVSAGGSVQMGALLEAIGGVDAEIGLLDGLLNRGSGPQERTLRL